MDTDNTLTVAPSPSQSVAPIPQIPLPKHPSFSSLDADVILQSVNSTLFCVHKVNLCALSAFFRDMFYVGNPDLSPRDDPILVSEPDTVLELLLPMFYPVDDLTTPTDFTKVESALLMQCYEATGKYQMWLASLALRSFVEPVISIDPFLVINLANRTNDSALLTKAVKASLAFDILADVSWYCEKTGVLWPKLVGPPVGQILMGELT
ncbi:hypothetical protein BKA62DRAFT_660441 [Auriculariales sp. MPI-PUGE-AT-0066]|nr:hypothetical protein BKA62DRAFT_660441 [Auriculariales sp. MPI-PUGE-AT-0066]